MDTDRRNGTKVRLWIFKDQGAQSWQVHEARRLPKARGSWKSLSGLSLPWDIIPICQSFNILWWFPLARSSWKPERKSAADAHHTALPPGERPRWQRGSPQTQGRYKAQSIYNLKLDRNPGSWGVILFWNHACRFHEWRGEWSRCITKTKLG